MKKKTKYIFAPPIILAWAAVFYLQFERPWIGAVGQNLSPSLLPSLLRHEFFWLLWLAVPLIVLAFFQGRFFCWYICPLGLLQDLLPSFRGTKKKEINTLFFLFLFGFGVFSLNLLALFDPLVSVNRAVSVLQGRLLAIVVFGGPLLIILLLSVWKKRWWCFKLCPLGALFDWIVHLRARRRPEENRPASPGRRRALVALGAGLAAGLSWRLFNRRRGPEISSILRPPGALAENEFTDRCIRCGSCVAVCLTGGIQPVIFQTGLEGIFTPQLNPSRGECDEFCNKCGQTCPTQAIRYMPLEEKRNFKMGTASIVRSRCIAWSLDKHCLVCAEYCPYLAIGTERNKNGIKSPVVIPELCRGCGLCEKQCFAHPEAAITVSSRGAGTIITGGRS
ncbi:MAG: 4Fe-4S binding protein [Candidatus Erginobacter occultus]|nr:4Fe-4S binding protein [Candidatus Erginobacter occultus]